MQQFNINLKTEGNESGGHTIFTVANAGVGAFSGWMVLKGQVYENSFPYSLNSHYMVDVEHDKLPEDAKARKKEINKLMGRTLAALLLLVEGQPDSETVDISQADHISLDLSTGMEPTEQSPFTLIDNGTAPEWIIYTGKWTASEFPTMPRRIIVVDVLHDQFTGTLSREAGTRRIMYMIRQSVPFTKE